MPSGTVTALLAETAVLPSRHTNNRKGRVGGEAFFRTGATAPSKTVGTPGGTSAGFTTYINIIVRTVGTTIFRVAGHHIIVDWDWVNIFVSGSLSLDHREGYRHRPASHQR